MYLPRPLIPGVAVTDAAIDLFGVLFPVQIGTYQEIILDQLFKALKVC